MLPIVKIYLLLLIICSGRHIASKRNTSPYNLTQMIHNGCQNLTNCTIELSSQYNYIITEQIELKEKDVFILKGSSNSVKVECNIALPLKNNTKAIISLQDIKEIYIGNINFNNCHPAHPFKVSQEVDKECRKRKYTYENNEEDIHDYKIGEEVVTDTNNRESERLVANNSIILINNSMEATVYHCKFTNYSYTAVTIISVSNVNLQYSNFAGGNNYARGVTFVLNGKNHNGSISPEKLTIQHCRFENLTMINSDLMFVISGGSFSELQPLYEGGGLNLYITNNITLQINIRKSNFKYCSGLNGGAISTVIENQSNVILNISDSNFYRNAAYTRYVFNSRGGAIMLKVSLARSAILALQNTSFYENCAVEGGAIGIQYKTDSEETMQISINNSCFKTNHAGRGGAISFKNVNYFESTEFKISSSIFEKNTALTGGAIFVMMSVLTLDTNVSIYRNKARFGGGLSLLASTLMLKGIEISIKHNTAKEGGGLFLIDDSKIVSLTPKLNPALIQYNIANYKGGGLYIYNKFVQYKYKWITEQGWAIRKIYCFLTVKNSKKYSLNISENYSRLGKNIETCLGDDLFVNSWGGCWDRVEHISDLFKGSIKFSKKNCSITLDITKYDDFNLNSMCKLTVANKNYSTNYTCDKDKINLNYYYAYMNETKKEAIEYSRSLTQNLYSIKSTTTIYVVYPGYPMSLKIVSRDGMDNKIYTDTQVFFSYNEASNNNKKVNLIFGNVSTIHDSSIISPANKFVTFKVGIQHHIIKSIYGSICLKSISTLRDVKLCVPVIITKCPPGFHINKESEVCEVTVIIKKGIIKYVLENKIMVEKNTLVVFNEENDLETSYCSWLTCKCNERAYNELDCIIDPLKPETQCLPKIEGKYCSRCSDKGYSIPPPFTIPDYAVSRRCMKCQNIFLAIIGVLVITGLFTLFIILFRIDIFSDYTRSITFYSSTLYLLSISCGIFESKSVHSLIPIIAFNMLVTHIFNICIGGGDLSINRAYFELLAPLIFLFYLAILMVIVNYSSTCSKYIGRNDFINQILTVIIVTYATLCNKAFTSIMCPHDSANISRWIFDEEQICFKGKHLVLACLAIIIINILCIFPVILFIISRMKPPSAWEILSVYQKRYRDGYKWWELMKLFFRVIVAAILTLSKSYLTGNLSCIIVSVLCIVLFVMTSVLKPSTNGRADNFEAFCIMVTAILGIASTSSKNTYIMTSILVSLPYVAYAYIVLSTKDKRIREFYTRVRKIFSKTNKIAISAKPNHNGIVNNN